MKTNISCMADWEWKPESINQTRILNYTVQHTHTTDDDV